MAVIDFNPSQLTTQASFLNRVKYFPIELSCSNLLPNTTYNIFINGQLVNAFCRPFGGKMGSPLTSTQNGQLKILFYHSVQYLQQFITQPNTDTNLINTTQQITLVDPFNNASTVNFPLLIKASV